jgi:hypothetical protein
MRAPAPRRVAPDDAGGAACGDAKAVDITRHCAASTHNATASYPNVRHDQGAPANPHVLLECHFPAARAQNKAAIKIMNAMLVACLDDNFIGPKVVFADFHFRIVQKYPGIIDGGSFTYPQSRVPPKIYYRF